METVKGNDEGGRRRKRRRSWRRSKIKVEEEEDVPMPTWETGLWKCVTGCYMSAAVTCEGRGTHTQTRARTHTQTVAASGV